MMTIVQIKSCYPEGQTIEEQAVKADEEMNELARETDNLLIANEALDVAVAAIGLAEIAIENDDYSRSTEKILQSMINSKYRRKQKEFAEEGE